MLRKPYLERKNLPWHLKNWFMKHGIYSMGTPNLLILLQNARKKEVNQILFRVLKN